MAGEDNTTRRDFLAQTAAVAAAGAVAGATPAAWAKPRRVGGANDRVNMAVLGIRSRGQGLAEGFARLENVHVKTIVDPDENLFPDRVKKLEQIQRYLTMMTRFNVKIDAMLERKNQFFVIKNTRIQS